MKQMLARYYMKMLRYFSSKCKELIKFHCSLTGSEKKYWEFIKSQNYCNNDKKNLNDILSQL